MTSPIAFILLGASLAASGQTAIRVDVNEIEAPIRVDVSLVSVGFTVRDAEGRLVTTLGREDIEIFEDAVRQNISFFARSAEVPLALGLAVDFSGSQERFIRQHHRDLETFLESVLGPRDRAFLVGFGNRLRLVSDFSSSAAQLGARLRRFEEGARRMPELGPREQRVLGTAFYDAVYYSVTERLQGAEGGRKVLLVFSDGEDNSSAHNMMEAIEAAQSAGVMVFAIRYTERKDGALTARNKYGIGVMDRLARETGGAHFDAEREDLREHFRRIGEELRSSYELAYHSSNPVRDGSFRKILVRPKQPGLNVRAKTGYFAR
jgi:Ca-activated chloride channel family protein